MKLARFDDNRIGIIRGDDIIMVLKIDPITPFAIGLKRPQNHRNVEGTSLRNDGGCNEPR